jgi:hypothetical protein
LPVGAHAKLAIATCSGNARAAVAGGVADFAIGALAVLAEAELLVLTRDHAAAAVALGEADRHGIRAVAIEAHRCVLVLTGVVDRLAATTVERGGADEAGLALAHDAHRRVEVLAGRRLAAAAVGRADAVLVGIGALAAEAEADLSIFAEVGDAASGDAVGVARAVRVGSAGEEPVDGAGGGALTAADLVADFSFGAERAWRAVGVPEAGKSAGALLDDFAASVGADLSDSAVLIAVAEVGLAALDRGAASVGADGAKRALVVSVAEELGFAVLDGGAARVFSAEPSPSALFVVLTGPDVFADGDAEAVIADGVRGALPVIAALVPGQPELGLAVGDRVRLLRWDEERHSEESERAEGA